MSKKKKSAQFPAGQKSQDKPGSIGQPTTPKQDVVTPVKYNPLGSSEVKSSTPAQSQAAQPQTAQSHIVRPEQMSLAAYHHIQECLKGRSHLSKDEVNAVLRLSQHLRVFGLLSAVGYLRHAKDKGEVAKQTKPIWMPLLWQLIYGDKPRGTEQELMKEVEEIAREKPQLYMVTWRKALILSNHWNFWAKAHQEEKPNERTQDSNVTG